LPEKAVLETLESKILTQSQTENLLSLEVHTQKGFSLVFVASLRYM